MSTGTLPTWFAGLMPMFPLITFGKAVNMHFKFPSSEHILYVAEGHPRPKRSLEGSEECEGTSDRTSWASRDPRCLAWQMTMLFAGICVRSEQVDTNSVFDEDYPGESFADVPVLLDRNGNRIMENNFVSWIKANCARREPKSIADISVDEHAVRCLIEGPLEAGVLLEMYTRPRTKKGIKRVPPFLSYHFENALQFENATVMATSLAAKQHFSPTSLSPNWSATMHGVLRDGLGTALGSFLQGGADVETDKSKANPPPSQQSSVGEDEVRQTACEALEAIAALAFPTGERSWICGYDRCVILAC